MLTTLSSVILDAIATLYGPFGVRRMESISIVTVPDSGLFVAATWRMVAIEHGMVTTRTLDTLP